MSGFSAAVGQFVLTASLRMQTSDSGEGGKSKGKNVRTEENEESSISHERFVSVYPHVYEKSVDRMVLIGLFV